ncbi:non-hydrolyzing UDP-N-acetylglucosamine 2-epimerase [Salinigranum halophilum]|uniref:non-hydrolyzing UDP-N-acetylglucosamine 2-epimerase n=1 Tax=Salinigranum halophilum TaxID=2565931 RepID=UPI00115E6927|nr:UDP-N-acetylglucosamine 2-epimerase (non-hydrolyzing) [Salinigranum halophilum]
MTVRDKQPTDVAIILGTRPEIIKLAPLIRECENRDLNFILIHTGQHYSESLDSVFFEQLDLPEPDYNLEIGSDSHGEQTGRMIQGIERILLESTPDVVLVQGDTNSVLAGAIASSKLPIELGHIEAGLRSFDDEMPEEVNRVLTDHAADYLFAPTEDSAQLLRNEGLPDDCIYVTGNTVVDAVEEHSQLALHRSDVLTEFELAENPFALVTAHRAENVDNQHRFQQLLSGIESVAEEFNLSVLYPIHPRARSRLDEFDIEIPDVIELVEPLDYLDFLLLEQSASIILTDSGGVQEEACILQTPCVTLRDNTERPETLDVGSNLLAGVDPNEILTCAREMIDSEHNWDNPFGDGTASEQILNISCGKTRKSAE